MTAEDRSPTGDERLPHPLAGGLTPCGSVTGAWHRWISAAALIGRRADALRLRYGGVGTAGSRAQHSLAGGLTPCGSVTGAWHRWISAATIHITCESNVGATLVRFSFRWMCTGDLWREPPHRPTVDRGDRYASD